MALTPGTKLGPYEIVSPIGAGGMGEVYRARDTRLDRTVAVKILPEHLSGKPEAKERFEREARAISGLNHPNICHLYDVGSQDGISYLVMEYLDGEILADRLRKGPLPLEQFFKIAIEVCDGLQKAHCSGVIHRDLKPGNIMLTKSGAKLLDFGLAKSVLPVNAPSSGLTMTCSAAEVSQPLTASGTVMGTFQYMSPEQVEGQEADARSDIFALGAVLYEMATGRRAFEGKTAASTMAAIMAAEPLPLTSIQPTSPALDHGIRRCLSKDPEERWQSVRDLAFELKWIRDSKPQESSAPAKRPQWFAWALALGVALVAVIFVLARSVVVRNSEPAAATRTFRYAIPPPESGNFLFGGMFSSPALSPDGRNIAFSARVGGVTRLWLRSMDSFSARPLPGTDDAYEAFWSPDSQNVAFFAQGKLKRISIAGGHVQTICEDCAYGRGASWNRQDIIIYGTSPGVIYRIPASGGSPLPASVLDTGRHDILHRWPFFLPDGNHFLYSAASTTANYENNAVFVGSLDGKAGRLLFRSSSPVVYANGYLLYVEDKTLIARPFDAAALEFTGNAVSVAEGIQIDPYFGGAVFSASENGVLLFRQSNPFSGYSLKLLDMNGKQKASLDEPNMYFFPRFAPDGKRVAYYSPNLQTGRVEVWVWDTESGSRMRMTQDAYYDRSPVWSPDGTRIAYISSRADTSFVLIKPAAGLGGEQERLQLTGVLPTLSDWTHDGRFLLLDESSITRGKSRILLLTTEGVSEAIPLLGTGSTLVNSGRVSPDGRWIAYRSEESGKSEVYLTAFPKPAGAVQVSITGGVAPRWQSDGKGIFYVAPDGKLMAADLTESSGTLQLTSVRPLFQMQGFRADVGGHYDAAPHGGGFVSQWMTPDETSSPLSIVVNWPASLRKN